MMRSLLLTLIGLFYCGLAFADQNLVMLYNDDENLDLKVYYATCYAYDNLSLFRKHYCLPANITLYAKNNPKGPSFAAVEWGRYPGSAYEYITIDKVVIGGNPGKYDNVILTFDLEKNYADTWYNNQAYHRAIIFSIKNAKLKMNYGVF